MSDGSGGTGKHPDNSPVKGGGMKRRQSHGSETGMVGDGAAVDGVKVLQAPQGSRGRHLSSEYLMTLKHKEFENTVIKNAVRAALKLFMLVIL